MRDIDSGVSQSPEKVLEFLTKVLKIEDPEKYTGWRILGYVNCSSGYPVYRFDLFAKGEGHIPLSGPHTGVVWGVSYYGF